MTGAITGVQVVVDTILLAELDVYCAKNELPPDVLLTKILEAGIRELVNNRPPLEE